jgi:hypothetical protein
MAGQVAAKGSDKLALDFCVPGCDIGKRGNGAKQQKRKATNQRERASAKKNNMASDSSLKSAEQPKNITKC